MTAFTAAQTVSTHSALKTKRRLMAAIVLFALAGHSYGASDRCPDVRGISQEKLTAGGYSYYSVSPGSGWKGENPQAKKSYLQTLKFTSAAIRTGQSGPGQPIYFFIACDYEGPAQYAFLRMSQRFPTRPRAVGPNWNEDFCRADTVDGCRFEHFEPVPAKKRGAGK
jgi:hypothetical protein